jgi:hypothetical protein
MVPYPSSSYTLLACLAPLTSNFTTALDIILLYDIACASIYLHVSPDRNIQHSFRMPVTGDITTRYSRIGRKERLGAELLANVSKPVSTSINLPCAFTCVRAFAAACSLES